MWFGIEKPPNRRRRGGGRSAVGADAEDNVEAGILKHLVWKFGSQSCEDHSCINELLCVCGIIQ